MTVAFGIFLIVDLYTFAAICSTKIDSGGWVAILIAVVLFSFSFSWFYGNIRLRQYLSRNSKTNLLDELSDRLALKVADDEDEDEPDDHLEDHLETVDDLDDSSTDDEQVFRDERARKSRQHRRKQLLSEERSDLSVSVIENLSRSTVDESERPVLTPGVACFLTTSKKTTPYVFETFLHQMKAHQRILIFLKIEYARMPNIDDDQRLIVRSYSRSIYHLTATFGYAETNINLMNIIQLAKQIYDVPIDRDKGLITFFLPHETIDVNTRGWKSWIRRWPLYVYSFLKNLYPGMPLNLKSLPENSIQVGIRAEL